MDRKIFGNPAAKKGSPAAFGAESLRCVRHHSAMATPDRPISPRQGTVIE
jgi:hypothetical protein